MQSNGVWVLNKAKWEDISTAQCCRLWEQIGGCTFVCISIFQLQQRNRFQSDCTSPRTFTSNKECSKLPGKALWTWVMLWSPDSSSAFVFHPDLSKTVQKHLAKQLPLFGLSCLLERNAYPFNVAGYPDQYWYRGTQVSTVAKPPWKAT